MEDKMRKEFFRILAAGVVFTSFATLPATGKCVSLAGEKPLAGITLSLGKYCDTVIADFAREEKEVKAEEDRIKEEESRALKEKAQGQKATIQNNTQRKAGQDKTALEKAAVKTGSSSKKPEAPQPEEKHLKLNLVYDRLGVANVHNYLNVRKGPSENAKITGKMTRNSGCNVYKIKKGWAKIVSGKVKGWVKAEYLLTDEKAELRAKHVATLRAEVSTETLNVRTLPSINSNIYDQISAEEEYTVGNKNITKAWLKRYMAKYCTKKDLRGIDLEKMYKDASNWVMLKIDEEKAFVSKDFIDFTYNLNRAVTIKQPSSRTGSQDSPGSSESSSSSISSSIVDYAMQFLGNRYVWGGTSLTGGTDCSGFVMRIYEHFGYYLPRTSRAQAAATRSISSPEVQAGDLFFYGSGSVSHVALYIGGGQIIHASNARDGIKISSAYYRQPLKIGRVM